MAKFGLTIDMNSLPAMSTGQKSSSNFDSYGQNKQRNHVKLPPLRNGSGKQSMSSIPSKSVIQNEGVTHDDIDKDRNITDT